MIAHSLAKGRVLRAISQLAFSAQAGIAFISAARQGRVQDLADMLRKAPEGTLDYCNVSGVTALHAAAAAGNNIAVSLLLERGAKINQRDNVRW